MLQLRAMVGTIDSSVAGKLLGQIPIRETIATFTGDGASNKDVHETCHQWKPFPSFHSARKQGSANGSSLHIAMRR